MGHECAVGLPCRHLLIGKRQPIEQELPRVGLEQAQEKVGKRGFAATGLTHKRNPRAHGNGQIHVAQHRITREPIGKRDIPQFDQTSGHHTLWRGHDRIGERKPGWTHAQQLKGILHFRQTTAQFVETAEHRLQRTGDAQQHQENSGQFRHRRPELIATTAQESGGQTDQKQNRDTSWFNQKFRNIGQQIGESIIPLGDGAIAHKTVNKKLMGGIKLDIAHRAKRFPERESHTARIPHLLTQEQTQIGSNDQRSDQVGNQKKSENRERFSAKSNSNPQEQGRHTQNVAGNCNHRRNHR